MNELKKISKSTSPFIILLVIFFLFFLGSQNSKRLTIHDIQNWGELIKIIQGEKSFDIKELYRGELKRHENYLTNEFYERLMNLKDSSQLSHEDKKKILFPLNKMIHNPNMVIAYHDDLEKVFKNFNDYYKPFIDDGVLVYERIREFIIPDHYDPLEKNEVENDLMWMNVSLMNKMFEGAFEIKKNPFTLSKKQMVLIFFFLFISLIVLYPLNGLYFLVLFFPFCLGNSKRPYFVYIDYCLYLTLFVGYLRMFIFYLNQCIKKKQRWNFNQFKCSALICSLVFFAVVSLLCLPVNLKELYYFLKGSSWVYIFDAFHSSNEKHIVYTLKVMMNQLSAILMIPLILFFNPNFKEVKNLIISLMVVLMTILFFCFAFRYDWVYHGFEPYLTIQFSGLLPLTHNKIAISGFAYNPGYLCQYLIALMPFLGCFILGKKKSMISVFSSIILILSIVAMLLTYQRGPFFVLIGLLLLGCFIYWRHTNYSKKTLFISLVFFFVLNSLLFIMDQIILNGSLLKRFLETFTNPSLRDKIWLIAFNMGKHNPIWGIGTGQFHYFFPEYCIKSGIPWEGHIKLVRTTAHNLYLHLFAERGVMGLGSFVLFISCLYHSIFKTLKKIEYDQKLLVLCFLCSMTGILFYGLSQHMFYLRILEIFFWFEVGLVFLMINSHSYKIQLNIRIILLIFCVVFILFSLRMISITAFVVK